MTIDAIRKTIVEIQEALEIARVLDGLPKDAAGARNREVAQYLTVVATLANRLSTEASATAETTSKKVLP